MRHLKTYESFGEESNIVKRFKINDMMDLLQEIFDDFDISSEYTVIFPAHICKKGEFDDLMGNVVCDINNKVHKFMIGSGDKDAYFIKFPKKPVNPYRITDIMDHKGDIHEFKYSILKEEQHIVHGQYTWKSIVGILIY